MSLHYLLDGYNIIKLVPEFADRSLMDGRLGLIRWVNEYRPQGSAKNEVTIFFDGKAEVYGSHDGGISSVVFSHYGTADDLIKEMVEASSQKKKFVVVSNDKDIVLYVRALGAKVLSVSEFMTVSSKKVAPVGKTAAGKFISLANQVKINHEVSKLWLKDK